MTNTEIQKEELEKLGRVLAEHRRQLTALMLKTEDLEAAVLMALEHEPETASRRIEKSTFR